MPLKRVDCSTVIRHDVWSSFITSAVMNNSSRFQEDQNNNYEFINTVFSFLTHYQLNVPQQRLWTIKDPNIQWMEGPKDPFSLTKTKDQRTRWTETGPCNLSLSPSLPPPLSLSSLQCSRHTKLLVAKEFHFCQSFTIFLAASHVSPFIARIFSAVRLHVSLSSMWNPYQSCLW